MHTDMEARACDLAEYLLANNTTVRAAAKQFGVSKSTVHKDLTERLEKINPVLYQQVRQQRLCTPRTVMDHDMRMPIPARDAVFMKLRQI